MVKFPIFAQNWTHRVLSSSFFVSPLCDLQYFIAKVHFSSLMPALLRHLRLGSSFSWSKPALLRHPSVCGSTGLSLTSIA